MRSRQSRATGAPDYPACRYVWPLPHGPLSTRASNVASGRACAHSLAGASARCESATWKGPPPPGAVLVLAQPAEDSGCKAATGYDSLSPAASSLCVHTRSLHLCSHSPSRLLKGRLDIPIASFAPCGSLRWGLSVVALDCAWVSAACSLSRAHMTYNLVGLSPAHQKSRSFS